MATSGSIDLGATFTAGGNTSCCNNIALATFGGGNDGVVAITGPVTLTRDMYYSNLTISGAGALRTANFLVYVSGNLDLSNAQRGAILNDGTTGNNGSNTGAAGTGVAPPTARSVGTGTNGTSGVAGATGNGANASGLATGTNNGGLSSTSGAGGAGLTGTGGTGGASTGVLSPIPEYKVTNFLNAGVSLITSGVGGTGGGGGGGDGLVSGGGGASGGSGAGIIAIFANNIIRGASTVAGSIHCNGGIGGIGGSPASGNSGGGGGGAGGGAGWIYLVYNTLSGATGTNLLEASGGAGGNGGTGSGTGSNGGGGRSGGQGRITVISTGANTVVDNVGAVTTYNNPSGQTGALINTYQVSL